MTRSQSEAASSLLGLLGDQVLWFGPDRCRYPYPLSGPFPRVLNDDSRLHLAKGTAETKHSSLRSWRKRGVAQGSGARAKSPDFAPASTPKPAQRPLLCAFCCFPHASPDSQTGVGKQKTVPTDRLKPVLSLRKFGAGEGIRTLDPNLGKRPRKP